MHFIIALIFLSSVLCITTVIAADMKGPLVDAVTYYNAAVDAAYNNSDEEAIILADKAIAIQPDFYLPYITKAGILSKAGNHSGAMTVIEEIEKTHSDNPYLLAAKASILINIGDFLQGRDFADKALEKDATLIEAWILKGTAHGALGEYEQELYASEQALRYDPDNPVAKSNYDYAHQKIRNQQDKNGQGDAEPIPLYVIVVLLGVLGGGFFYWNRK